MKISRTTIDKLGIKLYDKASAVVSELIANAYDADAENVMIKIPLSRWLATRSDGEIVDQGLEISVEDDGIGMEPNVINEFYLKVGPDPRKDKRRGPLSAEKKRPRMGRKGIGKLSPFGICKTVEVKSAGGRRTAKGYLTAHLILKYDDILQETDQDYNPEVGEQDRKYSRSRGTTITLRDFLHRRTPDADTFHRQVAAKFGLRQIDFRVKVQDTTSGNIFEVGELTVEIDEETKIVVDDRPVSLEDGTSLPVKGWVAYAKEPYSNVEIAGVRIYARGKLVSSTRDFGLRAGFTGEFTIRSYLVGVIQADWLDPDDGEDLIQSGRQDILWDSEKGSAFQKWGQELLRELGKKSWSPMQEKTWKIFLEKSNLEAEAKARFPDKAVFDSAMEMAKVFGRAASRDALKERPEYVEALKELVLTVAPHKLIVDRLKDVEKVLAENPLEAIASIFNDARMAEAASLGQVAIERIDAIAELEKHLSPETEHDEKTLQRLLEGAPWIIDPQWTMLQATKTFEDMRHAFERWYEGRSGVPTITSALEPSQEGKIPDFVMLHLERNVEIVEIKRPGHALTDIEFNRIMGYYRSLETFLNENPSFKEVFPEPHVTLVCDQLNLGLVSKEAYESLKDHRHLTKKTWEELLMDTKRVHEDFIKARHGVETA